MTTVQEAIKKYHGDLRIYNGRRWWMVWSEGAWEVYNLPFRCRIAKLVIRTKVEAEAIKTLIS